jgi:hypothetical protein
MSESTLTVGAMLTGLKRVRSLVNALPVENGAAGVAPTRTLPGDPPTQTFFFGLDESPDLRNDTTPFDLAVKVSAADVGRIGPYELKSILGRGGMGIVFKAEDTRLKRTVALKMLLGGGMHDPRLVQRFMIESQALARLDHPHVVPVYDVNQWEGLPYFVMKYVAGGTLAEAAPRLRKDPKRLIQLLEKICRAVAYLHEQKISHRDLKPLNVLLTENDDPLVADFGLAKFHDSDDGMTVTQCLLGTRFYMSPEQTTGSQKNLTPASDIWSLGVIVYETISGKLPFSGENQAQLFKSICTNTPPSVDALPGLDGDGLNRLLQKALAKDPANRYATATEFANDLRRLRDGDTVQARPPQRRGRWLVAASILTLLGVAIGLAISGGGRPIETIALIGVTGNPVVPVRVVTTGDLLQSVDAQQHYSLEATDIGIIDLGEYRIPSGFVIEATVQQQSTPDHFAYAGIFVRGHIETIPGGQFHWHAVTTRIDTIEHANTPNGFGRKLGSGLLGLGRWDPRESSLYLDNQHGSSVTLNRTRLVPGAKVMPQSIRMEVLPNGSVIGHVNDTPMKTLTHRDAISMRSTGCRNDRFTPKQVYGDHVGLIVENGSAAFWNVTLRAR